MMNMAPPYREARLMEPMAIPAVLAFWDEDWLSVLVVPKASLPEPAAGAEPPSLPVEPELPPAEPASLIWPKMLILGLI